MAGNRRGLRWPEATIRRFLRLVHKVGIREACGRTGVPYRTGYRWLRIGEAEAVSRAQAPRPMPPVSRERSMAMLARMQADPSLTWTAIAREYGVTNQAVSQLAHRHGLRRRNGRAA